MKKRVIGVLAVMCVISLALAGCGQVVEINDEDAMSVVNEIEEHVVEVTVAESEEESSKEVVEEFSEEVVEKSSEEVPQEATEELTVTVTEETTEESMEEVVREYEV